ncbi:MAG TPA: HAMP domain-containing sensor histidine kinase, partial [Gammaproteobacteria bacterium]|nr:HAMP domain-containing sensor histidine kinase [Gammaproteobacteria bacterium]
EGLNQILKQTERISRIVGSLSNFSHAGSPDESPAENIDLAQIVGEAINLVSLSQDGKQMQYENRCEVGLMVAGYAHKLVQVFVNLLTNATDASLPGQIIRVASEMRGNQVSISVSDRGEGIAEEHLPRVFEPFFTTKTVGEGTGLGLSLTYNIVQEHGGSISVSSRQGEGCRFEILLPRIDTSMAVQA